METIIQVSRKAYAICIIGMGLKQLALGIIDADFLPGAYSTNPVYHLMIYPWGIAFTLSGIAFLFNKIAYQASLVSAGVFLMLLLFVYIPYFIFFYSKCCKFFRMGACNTGIIFCRQFIDFCSIFYKYFP